MKITPSGSGAIDAYNKQTNKNKAAPKTKTMPEQDRAEISSRGREILTYRALLKEMPGIRTDKVEDIKNRLASGTYEPSAEKTAEGMMKERRLETTI